jgi:hypothetical protein
VDSPIAAHGGHWGRAARGVAGLLGEQPTLPDIDEHEKGAPRHA